MSKQSQELPTDRQYKAIFVGWSATIHLLKLNKSNISFEAALSGLSDEEIINKIHHSGVIH